MIITDEMINQCCQKLDSMDWLPYQWDAKETECPNCHGRTSYGEGDGGESIRREVREILEAAINGIGLPK